MKNYWTNVTMVYEDEDSGQIVAKTYPMMAAYGFLSNLSELKKHKKYKYKAVDPAGRLHQFDSECPYDSRDPL